MFKTTSASSTLLSHQETRARYEALLKLDPLTQESLRTELLDIIIYRGTGPFSVCAIESKYEIPLAKATCSTDILDLFQDIQNLIESAKVNCALVGFYLDTLYQLRILELPEIVDVLAEDEDCANHFISKILESYFVFVALIEEYPDDYAALSEIKSPFTPLQLLDEMIEKNQIPTANELAAAAQSAAMDTLRAYTNPLIKSNKMSRPYPSP